MKHQDKKLLLKDFLESRELDSCVHLGLEMALENVIDGNVGTSPLYHLDNLCYDVFQRIPAVTSERTLFRFTYDGGIMLIMTNSVMDTKIQFQR